MFGYMQVPDIRLVCQLFGRDVGSVLGSRRGPYQTDRRQDMVDDGWWLDDRCALLMTTTMYC